MMGKTKTHYCYKQIINTTNTIIYITRRHFGIGSFHSKYVIIGSGFTGLSLTRLLKQVI